MRMMRFVVSNKEFKLMTNSVLGDVFKIGKQVMVFLRVEVKGGFVKDVPCHHLCGEVADGVFSRLFSKCCAAPNVGICDRQNSSSSAPSIIDAMLRELGRIDVSRVPKSTYSMFFIFVRHWVGTGGGR